MEAVDLLDGEAAVVPYGDDPVGLAVDRRAGVAGPAAQLPAVAAGLDQVAEAGGGAVATERHAVLADPPEADELRPDLGGQAGGFLVGVDDQHGPAAGEGVGEPGAGGRGPGLLPGAAVDQPAVAPIVVQHGLVAVAQPEGRRALPAGAEPAYVGQLMPAGGGQQSHGAAGADRGELAVVTGQEQLGSGGGGVAVHGDQVGGGEHRGLVDDDQVSGRRATTPCRPAGHGRTRVAAGWPASA